jgi:glycosyltransferase 2 family protein
MTNTDKNIFSQLHPRRIIIPVAIGLIVVLWLILKDININILKEIEFTWRSAFWLIIAWFCMVGRDLGYMIRIRILSENDLTWRQAFRVIMLWEFTSAITPSTVGGTAVAVVFIHKEGVSVGRSTAMVLATSFLDELYFVIMFPLILLIVGKEILFTTSLEGTGGALLNNLTFVAIAGYGLILAWVLFVGYGLFINPDGIRKTIIWIFKLPILRKFRDSAIKAGNDIVESSHELKKKPLTFWIKAFTATFLSWTSRYWVINAILMAFFDISQHFLIFARQLVTWIMMIMSPTPGGSGFAEVILSRYISDAIPLDAAHVTSVALAMAIIWRIISYYPYLIIGASIIPGWIQRKFMKPSIKKI